MDMLYPSLVNATEIYFLNKINEVWCSSVSSLHLHRSYCRRRCDDL